VEVPLDGGELRQPPRLHICKAAGEGIQHHVFIWEEVGGGVVLATGLRQALEFGEALKRQVDLEGTRAGRDRSGDEVLISRWVVVVCWLRG
jgi:hypothetical protein